MIQNASTKVGWFVLGLLLVACGGTATSGESDSTTGEAAKPETNSSTPQASPTLPAASLPDLGPAPDIANQEWLNTDRPLNLAALEGKVVLVEFWTFG